MIIRVKKAYTEGGFVNPSLMIEIVIRYSE